MVFTWRSITVGWKYVPEISCAFGSSHQTATNRNEPYVLQQNVSFARLSKHHNVKWHIRTYPSLSVFLIPYPNPSVYHRSFCAISKAKIVTQVIRIHLSRPHTNEDRLTLKSTKRVIGFSSLTHWTIFRRTLIPSPQIETKELPVQIAKKWGSDALP